MLSARGMPATPTCPACGRAHLLRAINPNCLEWHGGYLCPSCGYTGDGIRHPPGPANDVVFKDGTVIEGGAGMSQAQRQQAVAALPWWRRLGKQRWVREG